MALFPIAANQVQFSTDTPVATDTYARSILRDAGNTVARSATSGGVQYANGLLFTALGQVVTVDATAGLPAGTQFVNGLPLTATGALCVSTDAAVSWSNGLPFVANGALAAGGSVLPFLKAAALAAPVNQAGITYSTIASVTLGAEFGEPVIPGGYTRHWISGAGNTGSADLKTVSNIYNINGYALTQGGIINNQGDGSAATWWNATVGTELGNASPTYLAFRHTGRYIDIPGRGWMMSGLRVNGQPANVVGDYTGNNQQAAWDLGSVAARDIVLCQGFDTWFSEVSVGSSDTMNATYNPFASKPTFHFFGDSYLAGSSDYTTSKMLFTQLMTDLCGGLACTVNAIGGTGYDTDNNSDPSVYVKGANPKRWITTQIAQPDVAVAMLGINEIFPLSGTFSASMLATLGALRANSKLLVVVGPWSPNQVDGANAGGKYQAIRTQLRAAMPGLGGAWIYVDNLTGGWLTSKGTSNAGSGPWQTGTGYVGNTTGTGNGDTWVSADGTHPTELGYRGLSALFAASYKAALASM